jgi:tetratricopeptide (TPR) repeat protein
MDSPSNQQSAPAAAPPIRTRTGPARVRVVEARIAAVLAAHRSGSLQELLRENDRVMRRYSRRVLLPVLATAGDALSSEGRWAEATALWLRWAVTQLRPDRRPDFEGIDRAAWLDRTSWRPMLATAGHYGFASVPDFRDRYRRRTDESVSDNLCGLWAIGPSTFYRYLDKGKQQIALLLLRIRKGGYSSLGLRCFVHNAVANQQAFVDATERQAWHAARAQASVGQDDPVSGLWHFLHAHDPSSFVITLHRHRAALARQPDVSSMIDMLAREQQTPRHRFDLLLAQAALARHRGDDEDELYRYNTALRIASDSKDNVMLGEVYGVLGKFHELRNADRAFAYYEDSAHFLGLTGSAEDELLPPQVADVYVETLARLAWLYVSRNDSKARAVLEQVQSINERRALSDELVATLEQTWGEYWRRAGDLRRALECKHRALNLFERLGDQRSVIVTFINLSLIYGEARDFSHAVEYGQRVLDEAARISLAPEMLVSVHGNLGVAFFWQNQFDEAISEYKLALEVCQNTGLDTPLSTLHYNLAEAFYKRFQLSRDPEDEHSGDMHAAISMRASPSAKDQSHIEATRKLKSQILGSSGDGNSYDRLLPEEFAAHFEEMLEVQRHRHALALPSAADAHVRARLAIARAYLNISAKEREAALALIRKHNLGDQFAQEFEDLRNTFTRELTREQQVAAQWQTSAAEILQEERRIAVLEYLFHDGSIQKSVYARLCGVGLATASKHLTMLANRGLLVQSGRGPSTRYALPRI